MTNKSARKQVDSEFWRGRLESAEAYLAAAEQLLTLAAEGQNCNPIASHIALSAVAFCDALTARHAGAINQQDHATAPKLLRDVMREKLPDVQERRLKRMLGRKDEAQYGARRTTLAEAQLQFEELQEFATWSRDELG
jgi:hypothetical protein